MDNLLNSKYQLEEEIGRGTDGVVYRAVSIRDGTPLAVKILQKHSDWSREAFNIEYDLLCRLRHPHILPLLDFGLTENGAPCWVMPLIDAWTPADFHHQMTPETAREYLLQAIHALDYLHRAGVIHGDLKPGNILLEKTSGQPGFRLLLSDFGMARLTRTGRSDLKGGSFPYMAPEGLIRGWIDPRSDLFSLGVTFSELLTGQIPFASPEEYRRLLRPSSTMIRRQYPAMMEQLGEIADTLMAPNPNQRYQSPRDVLLAAGNSAGGISLRGYVSPPGFMGRTSSLDELDGLAATHLSGIGAAVLLDGEPGSGRTRLLLEWDARCRMQNMECAYFEPTGKGLMGDAVRCFAIPESSSRISAVLAEIRKKIDEISPCIYLIDEVDTSDPPSRQIFMELFRDPPPRTLFVFTRSEPGGFDWTSRISLDPMDESSIRTMIRFRCVPKLPDSLVEMVVKSGGNQPGPCNRLFDSFIQSGVIVFERNSWRLKREPGILGEELSEAGRCWFESLDVTLKQPLGEIACLGWRIDIDMIRKVIGMDIGSIRTVLRRLLQSGVIGNFSGHLEFIDKDIARCAIAGITPERKRSLDRGAAAYIEETSHDKRAAGFHWLHAGDMDKAVPALFQSAVETVRCGSIDAGLSLFELIQAQLDNAGIPELHGQYAWRIGLEKGNALVRSGDHAGAVSAFESALASARNPDEKVTIMGNLATALYRQDQTNGALSLLNDAILLAGHAALITQQGILHAQLGNLLFHLERYSEAGDAYHKSLPFLENARNDRILAAVWNNLGSIREADSDFDGAFTAYTRGLPLKRRIGDKLGEAVLRHNIGHILTERGRLRAATIQLEYACRMLEAAGETPHRIQFLGNLAIAAAYRGHYRSAMEMLDRADPRVHEQHDDKLRIWLISVRGRIYTDCANPDSAIQIMEPERDRVFDTQPVSREFALFAVHYLQALTAAGRHLSCEFPDLSALMVRDPLLRCDYLLANSRAALIAGRTDHAAALATEVIEIAGEFGLFFKSSSSRMVLAETWLAKNRPDKVLQILSPQGLADIEKTGAIPLLVRWTSLTAIAYDKSNRSRMARNSEAIAGNLIDSLQEHLPPECDPEKFMAELMYQSPMTAGQNRERVSETAQTETAMDDRKKLTMLLDISGALNRETDLNILLERIVDHALELTGAERGFLYLKPSDGAEAVLVPRNIDPGAIFGEQSQISTSVMEDVLKTGRAVILSDSLSEDHFKSRRSILAHNLRTIMCVPLNCSRTASAESLRQEPDGILYVDGTAIGPCFGPVERDILIALSTHAGIGLANLMQRSALSRENRVLKDQIRSHFNLDQLIGTSAPMMQLKDMIRKVAPTQTSVLVFGESGTGKELVARTIHFNSPRSDGPFLGVNCAALSESILESELFGVEAGVATGVRRRTGLFVQANRGTLFLDEIGDMPLNMQVKILRVLQERSVRPVGGKATERIDVRIVCATNKDLWEEVRQGRFREDLLYRLDVISVTLPSLRSRVEDLPLLARFFLTRHAEEMKIPVPALSLEALRRMAQYSWPGNVRELENQMQRALVLAEPGRPIEPCDLSPRIGGMEADHVLPLTMPAQNAAIPPEGIKLAVAGLEISWIRKALEITRGNKAETARILGLSREGLRLKMRRLNLDGS